MSALTGIVGGYISSHTNKAVVKYLPVKYPINIILLEIGKNKKISSARTPNEHLRATNSMKMWTWRGGAGDIVASDKWQREGQIISYRHIDVNLTLSVTWLPYGTTL